MGVYILIMKCIHVGLGLGQSVRKKAISSQVAFNLRESYSAVNLLQLLYVHGGSRRYSVRTAVRYELVRGTWYAYAAYSRTGDW
jgi:hypothetical protein